MRPRYWIAFAIGVLLVAVGAVAINGQTATIDSERDASTMPDESEERIDLQVERWAAEEPTATMAVVATPSHEPSANVGEWHPATDHEHGEAPPQWATDFSMERFGHGILYGGDETTPRENELKHVAYKGQIVPSSAGGEAYVRFHAQSNPHGRAAQFHSYELYYRDTAGGVSFFQGWVDCGDPGGADRRFVRRRDSETSVRPTMLVVDQTAWDQGIRTEQWYCHGTGARLVEIGVNINQATTLFHEGEYLNNPHDQTTWDATGSDGNTRLVDFFLLESRYDGRSGDFCLTVMGESVDCGEAGGLPQYIAPTLYDDMRVEYEESRVSGQREVTHPCPDCQLPN